MPIWFYTFTVPVSDVHLTSGQDAVNVGQPMTLTCQTNYCNPQASIKWYKGTYPISSGIDIKFDKDTNNLQRTTSILMYSFNADDNGLQVHCTASNSLDKTVVSENHTLDLKCKLNRLLSFHDLICHYINSLIKHLLSFTY